MPTDEKDTNAGQRGTIKNKFQKRSYAYHQYHDPTYMSFFIMIDWHHSKLFNGMAVEFLKETLGDPLRAAKLERFTKNFQKLVMEMPWCFQEMEGLDNAFKGFDLKKNFRGGDDAVLKFKMLESTDLLITGLMDMYRDVVLDLKRWCRVLPSNMTYFDMYVIVSDARRIAERRPDVSNHSKSDFSNDPRYYFEINTGIAATAKAHFMVKFKKCSFKLDTATEIFAGISNAEPKLIEGVGLEIQYQIIEYWSKQYLNAFEGTIGDNRLSEERVGPQPGQDNPPQQASYGDTISGKANSPNSKKSTLNPIETSFIGKTKDKISGFKDKVKETTSPEGREKFLKNLEDKIVEGAKQVGNNLLDDAAAMGEGAARRFIADKVGALLLGNVYGVNTNSNIQDALSAGSLNGIINLVNQESENNSIAEEGSLQPFNVFPEIQVESPLISENVIEPSQPEAPLSPENIIPASQPEATLPPHNVFPPKTGETPLDSTNVNE